MTKVVVIGAGIIGLSTAVTLQSAGFVVTVVAESIGCETTSAKAGGKIEIDQVSNGHLLLF